jgi:PEP-CTERM motif
MRLAQGILVSLVFSLTLIAPSAKAAPLTPGTGPTAPDVLSGPHGIPLDSIPGSTVLGKGIKRNNSFSIFNGQTSTGTGAFVIEAIAAPGNVFCSGCVDIIFQVRNDSSSTVNLTRVTLSGFNGYSTDVGYDPSSIGGTGECGPGDSGFCPNTNIPNTVDRLMADVIGFNFGGIVHGAETVDLVIETNALSVTDPAGLSVYASDGSSALGLGNVYAPIGSPVIAGSSIPEPATLALLSLAFARIGWARRRKLH